MSVKSESVLPYGEDKGAKKGQIAEMFNNISPDYDLLNHILSFGFDIYWRNRLVAALDKTSAANVLDVATGTGDLALACATPKRSVTGVDISTGMLALGRVKVVKAGKTNIELLDGDSEHLPFETNQYDAVVAAFGVRNFEKVEAGLAEMCRVMKPGGFLGILEFSKPRSPLFAWLCKLYFRSILPVIGRMVSKDTRAYTYLPESVSQFPDGDDFTRLLSNAGFAAPKAIPLTFGVCTLYLATK